MRLSGVAVVDRVIGGIAPGLPLVVAGPPGSGRTVLALELADAFLGERDIVAFLSSEPAALLLRQAVSLGLDLETPLRNEQLLLLELAPTAAASLANAGAGALVEAIQAEHPSVSVLVIDSFNALTSEILDEAPLRALVRDLLAATPRTSLVLTVETDRAILDAPVERALAEVCGSLLMADRRGDGRRTLAIGKTRAGAGPAEAVEFEIGAEGTRLLRDIPLDAARRPGRRDEAGGRVPTAPPAVGRPAEPAPSAPEVPAPGPPPQPPEGAPPPPAPRPPRERARLLLIDAGEDASQLGAWLEERYEVVTASDGFQGVAKLLGERPDLILLDLVLPRVSGFEVISALHQADTAIPILVVTGRQERRGDRLGPIVLGAADVLRKPVDRFELLHKIETALRLEAPPPPPFDPVEAGRLFAPIEATRLLSLGEFRERVSRASEFGERFAAVSTLVALEAESAESVDRIVAAAEETLRFEDAVLVTAKRRLLCLLVAADPSEARRAMKRLLQRASSEGPLGRLRAAFSEAALDDGDRWEPLFGHLEAFEPTAPGEEAT